MDKTEHKESEFRTWMVVFCLVVIILGQGFFSFFVIGDRGQPDWAFRPVPDVPGQSPYAVYEPLPHPQHVKGAEGE